MLKSRSGFTADKKKKEKSIVGAVRCERERERDIERTIQRKKESPGLWTPKKDSG